MTPLRLTRRSLAFVALALAAGLGAGCSSKGTTITESGSIALSINPTSATLQLGGSALVTATITRSGGFTGTVNLTVTGAPSGVSASVSSVQTNGSVTTGIVTISADASTQTGTYTLVVHGTGSGVTEATATFTLTVEPLPAAYALIVNNTPSIVQGGNGVANIVLVRQNFTGAVTLVLEGNPTGITGVFGTNPVPGTGTASALTLTVAASVAPGTYNMTVRGMSSLTDRTQIFAVNVTAAAPVGNFTLSTTPTPSVNVTQGTNAVVNVNVLRSGGFTGAVTLTATGNPAGLAAGIAPNPTIGDATLTLTAAGGLAVGAYPIVIHGNFTGLTEQTANLLVNVLAPSGSGNVTVSSVGCAIQEKPLWAAAQDGSGPFQVVVPVSELYTFSLSSGKGAFAYIVRGGSGTSEVIQMHMSQAEWTAGVISLCPGAATAGTKVIDGNVAGLGAGELAQVSLGGGQASVFSPLTAFHMTGILDGPHDQVGFKRAIAGLGAASRGFLQRDQNPPHLSTSVLYDFTSGASFTPLTAAITVTGLAGAENLGHGMFFHTGASCDVATLYAGVPSDLPSSFTAYGVPTVLLRAGDRHGLYVTGTASPRFRSIIEYFNVLSGHSVALPSSLPVPTVTELGVGGGYSRRRVALTLPADLPGMVSFVYAQNGSQRSALLTATPAYLAGLSVNLVLGDFTGLAGWDPSAAPVAGSPADYSVTATLTNTAGSLCSGTNVRALTSSYSGTN